MISANQMYKQSKSSLPFKEWLKHNQNRGILDNHEKMYNLIDEAEDEVGTQTTKPLLTTQQGTKKLGTINLIGIIAIGVLIYGLSKVTTE